MKKAHKYVGIYVDFKEKDIFYVGNILAVDKSNLLLQSISTKGNYDGYLWMRTDSIYRCESDGMYEQKMKNLIKEEGCKYHNFRLEGNGKFLFQLLEYAMLKKLTISVSVRNEKFAGSLKGFSENAIKISAIDCDGSERGIECFFIREIDMIKMAYTV